MQDFVADNSSEPPRAQDAPAVPPTAPPAAQPVAAEALPSAGPGTGQTGGPGPRQGTRPDGPQTDAERELASVALGALGGTIAMTRSDSHHPGAQPALTAQDLASQLTLPSHIRIAAVEEIANVPSPSITLPILRQAFDFANRAVDEGAAGVVFTHGTDTMEESAFLFDLIWDRPEPVVFTGAMRDASQSSYDGTTNIDNAMIVAASEHFRGRGVLVVMADLIHTAARVRKIHTHSVAAFQSFGAALGVVREGLAHAYYPPGPRHPRLQPAFDADLAAIPMLTMSLGDDGRYLRALAREGARGIVIVGVGAGHVPAPAAPIVSQIVEGGVPVVVCTRVPDGGTLQRTYGYVGAEIDLADRGVIMGGSLSGVKARLLLHHLLAAGASRDQIVDTFRQYWG